MSFVEVYILFAVTTAIWSVVTIIPAMRKKLFEHNMLEHHLYNQPIMTAITIFVIAFIAAPAFIVGVVSSGTRFTDVFVETITKV